MIPLIISYNNLFFLEGRISLYVPLHRPIIVQALTEAYHTMYDYGKYIPYNSLRRKRVWPCQDQQSSQ